jgi:hypothetical protein
MVTMGFIHDCACSFLGVEGKKLYRKEVMTIPRHCGPILFMSV